MSNKPLELEKDFSRDSLAEYIANTWFQYNAQKQTKKAEWQELRNYIFATDTSSTSNSSLPWKNRTTLPKICQIRDNLYSNYISALFPNDDWLRWEAYTADSAAKDKKDAITAYMSNKCREGGFRDVVGQLLLDYIDYGNAFAMPTYEHNQREDDYETYVDGYRGPKAIRISPLDIVFNPLASDFKKSWKIIRSYKTLGELKTLADTSPDDSFWKEALDGHMKLMSAANGNGIDLGEKAESFAMDGFGSFQEYLTSGYVEILEFYGDIHCSESGELKKGRIITVVDRMWVARDVSMPYWFESAPIFHVGWRLRPDNLWAMGPLDNLVGMQYRIDHLENAKADATDLAIMPPLVIAGEVEQFEYSPGSEIHVDEGGMVTELARNVQWVITAENQIAALEGRMELFAGAPREAMGIRTAGEKTAYEVQQLQNAAARIFQEKINTFETKMLEPLLNAMLETARRNLDNADVVRSIDNDLGATNFSTITKEDITASGVIRPIGARHFAAQAQLMQNLAGFMNTPAFQVVSPHLSSIKLSQLIENTLGLSRFDLFRPNVAIMEQQETERLAGQAQEELMTEMQQPLPEDF